MFICMIPGAGIRARPMRSQGGPQGSRGPTKGPRGPTRAQADLQEPKGARKEHSFVPATFLSNYGNFRLFDIMQSCLFFKLFVKRPIWF